MAVEKNPLLEERNWTTVSSRWPDWPLHKVSTYICTPTPQVAIQGLTQSHPRCLVSHTRQTDTDTGKCSTNTQSYTGHIQRMDLREEDTNQCLIVHLTLAATHALKSAPDGQPGQHATQYQAWSHLHASAGASHIANQQACRAGHKQNLPQSSSCTASVLMQQPA